MALCVADAGPLIALAKIDRFRLLEQVFGQIVVPPAVWDEVVVGGGGRPAADDAVAARREKWLAIKPVEDTLAVRVLRSTLGAGESEAIILAQQLGADWLLVDDDSARSEATNLGVKVKGTAGILLAAYTAGLLDDLQEDLDHLRAGGFWLDDRVYDAVMRSARGERDEGGESQ